MTAKKDEKPPAQTPPATPTPEELTKRTEEAERKAKLAENQAALYAELAARTKAQADAVIAQATQPQSQPQGPDPLDVAFSDDLTKTPAEKRAAFERALAERAAASEDRLRQEAEQRSMQDRMAAAQGALLTELRLRRPDIVENAEKFSGAVAMAVTEANKEGKNLGPEEVLKRAEKLYDEYFGRSVPRPNAPRNEFGNPPNLNSPLETEPPQRSEIEQMYGMKAGAIEGYPRNREDWEEKTREYLIRRNKPLLDKGMIIGDAGLETFILGSMEKPNS